MHNAYNWLSFFPILILEHPWVKPSPCHKQITFRAHSKNIPNAQYSQKRILGTDLSVLQKKYKAISKYQSFVLRQNKALTHLVLKRVCHF